MRDPAIEEIYIVAREQRQQRQQKARERIMLALREGAPMPGLDELARARGLVIRERENSIFSDAWPLIAIMFILIGLVASRNAAMLALGMGLLVIMGVSTWWKRVALRGVTYVRQFDRTHVFPGEPVEMTLTITNGKPLPLTWLQFKDLAPIAPAEASQMAIIASEIGKGHALLTTMSLNGFERRRRMVTFRFPRRGYFEIGPVTYISGDVYTLFTVEREHRYIDRLVVYPQIYPLEKLLLPAKEMFGEEHVFRSLFVDPIRTQGIRDYQPEDRFRDVHWKASARRGDLQTKVYDPASGINVAIFLNVATMARHWLGFDPELLERAVSVTSSIASYAAEQRWGIGVFANGSIPGSDQPIRVPPGRSRDQLMRILEALAAVTEFATGSIELLMHKESRRITWSATLVLVTAIVTDEIASALIRLKQAGRRIVLITLAEEAPPDSLQGILSYHVPGTVPAFQKGRLTESMTEAALESIPAPVPLHLDGESRELHDGR